MTNHHHSRDHDREHRCCDQRPPPDQCHDCRTCTACLVSVHSCCFPVTCANGPGRHGCNCVTCHPELAP